MTRLLSFSTLVIGLLSPLAHAQTHDPLMEIKRVECASASDSKAPHFFFISYADAAPGQPPYVIRAVDVHGISYAETPIREDQLVYRFAGERPTYSVEYRIDANQASDASTLLRLRVSLESKENGLQIVKYPFRDLASGRVQSVTLGQDTDGANDYRCKILE